MWRLIYAIPSWVLFIVFRTAMILLGWIVVPVAAAFGAYEEYVGQDGMGVPRKQYRFKWWCLYPWGNEEDGIANDTYVKYESMFMRIVYWSCLRNPANNLRYVPLLFVRIRKERVGFVARPRHHDLRFYDLDDKKFWSFTWQGFYSNFRWQFGIGNSIYRLWVGWKIYPEDREYEVTGHRVSGAGFGQQFKKVWPK